MRLMFVTSVVMGTLFCTCFSGCGSDQANAVKKQIALMNEFADDLAKIKSNAGLVDEKPELEKLGARLADQENEVKKLPKPSHEEITKMQADYKQDYDKAEARLKDEMQRLGKDVGPAAAVTVVEALKVNLATTMTVDDWMKAK